MMMHVDLNADLGEGAGHDDELFELVTSASIACGVHAGDPAAILESIKKAGRGGISVGAHPSVWDRENFGRRELAVTPAEIFTVMIYQLAAFQAIARHAAVPVRHTKPHGALYNMAVRDRALADSIARAIAFIDPSLILFAPSGTELARAGEANRLRVAHEVFADRNYLANGSLVPRSRPDALLKDPVQAAERVMRMLREGVVRSVDGADVQVVADTICLHGDNLEAVRFARSLRKRLEQEGISVQPVEFKRGSPGQ
jgi:UPF0271 protein